MSKSRYSPATDLMPGDEFFWKATDLKGNGLVYYVVTHIVEGVAYAYQEGHPARVLPIDMTEEVRITDRNHVGIREASKLITRLLRYADRTAERHPQAVTIPGQSARADAGIWLAEFSRHNSQDQA